MDGGGNLPVGPGIWGFIAFFVLAIALWLLVRNMNSRLRRMAYTDRERAQAAEARTSTEADGVGGSAQGSGSTQDGGSAQGSGTAGPEDSREVEGRSSGGGDATDGTPERP
jgi:hypothetical protein